MLTVKYIDLAGNETVFAAQEVRYSAEMQLDSDSQCGGLVWFERPEGKAEGVLAGVSCGSVFVMNEAGKTVATYRLGDPSAKGCAAGVIGISPSGGVTISRVGPIGSGGVAPVTVSADANT